MGDPRLEAAGALDSYVELGEPTPASQVRSSFRRYASLITQAGLAYSERSTNQGSRRQKLTVTRAGGRQGGVVDHPFEIIGKKLLSSGGGSFKRDAVEVTCVRALDPIQVVENPDNHTGSWYTTSPANIHFPNGRLYHENGSEDVWAVFAPVTDEDKNLSVVTAQIIEPDTAQAAILGNLAHHLRTAVAEL